MHRHLHAHPFWSYLAVALFFFSSFFGKGKKEDDDGWGEIVLFVLTMDWLGLELRLLFRKDPEKGEGGEEGGWKKCFFFFSVKL